ncbi:hypothetical protein LWC08_08160 [Desulfobaculum bizertense]|uniref:hypothetical protein n=1 Tax=Desulfobaculum bizertense TaxID=376490 RepID=UPI001F21C913|nr:hypothetical protein [Desulfobaculum bizertense]UIJ36715.1 hypothetical protein LWC08_08160 [Desulfobaculum bizertense]
MSWQVFLTKKGENASVFVGAMTKKNENTFLSACEGGEKRGEGRRKKYEKICRWKTEGAGVTVAENEKSPHLSMKALISGSPART